MPTLEAAIDSRKGRQGAESFEKSIKKLQGATKKYGAAVTQAETKTKKFGGTAAAASAIVGKLFAAISAVLVIRKVITTMAEFEQKMAEIQAVTGTTGAELELFEDRARALGATTKFTATQAGEGLLFLSRAGFTTAESLEAIEPALNLAAAGMLSLGEAADIASNVMAQFGLAATDVEHIADILVNTANSANTNVLQLAQAMKFAGPIAGALGISLEETAAAAGALGDAGIQASLAGTNLRGIFSSLLGPTGVASKALTKLGISIHDINPVTHDLVEIFKILEESNLSVADAVAIFGRRNAAAAIILTQSIDKIEELTRVNLELEGTVARQAEIMKNTVIGAWKEFNSILDEVILSVGDSGLSGLLKDFIEIMKDVLVFVDEFVDETNKGITGFVAIIQRGFINIEFAAKAVWAVLTNGFNVLWESWKFGAQSAVNLIIDIISTIPRAFQIVIDAIADNTFTDTLAEWIPGLDSVQDSLKGMADFADISAQNLKDLKFEVGDNADATMMYAEAIGETIIKLEKQRQAAVRANLFETSATLARRIAIEVEKKTLLEEQIKLSEEELNLKKRFKEIQDEINAIRDKEIKTTEKITTVTEGLIAVTEDYSRTARDGLEIANLSLGTALRSFENFVASVSTGTRSVKEAFRSMSNAIIGDITRIFTRLATTGLFNILGGFFQPTPISPTQAIEPIVEDFRGGPPLPENPLIVQQSGGSHIFSGPQRGFTPNLRLHGSERVDVTPIRSGMTGDKNGNVVINIINNGNNNVETEERDTPNGQQINVLITDIVERNIRRGGTLNQAMRDTFGVANKTGGR